LLDADLLLLELFLHFTQSCSHLSQFGLAGVSCYGGQHKKGKNQKAGSGLEHESFRVRKRWLEIGG
jgi:hypothetical protein